MSEFDLVIRGGTVVTGSSQFQADVCIREDRIEALTLDPRITSDQVLDATGKMILPGIIDAHVHMQIMQQDKYPTADDFESGTRAAAAGGVTSIIDFAEPEHDRQTLWGAFEARRALADPQVAIDYGLHAIPTKDTDLGKEFDKLIEAGVTSFKLFQVYGRLALNDAQLYATLALVGSHNALATLHAENGQVADLFIDRLRAENKTKAIYHAHSRPPFVESTCIQTAINFTEDVDGNLYIVHLSTGSGLEEIREAQRRGAMILAETCPQYLVLDENRMAREDGNLYLCTPPLRPVGNQEELWKGLADGSIQVAATDHCSFFRQQKLNAPSFYQAPGGLGSIELLLPILYSEGVVKGRFSMSKLVQLLCHNPARIFGLAPKKGFLQPGSDADLVVFDPQHEWQVTSDQLHGKDDYSVYEGMTINGRVITTVSRGEVIFEGGKVKAKPGRGQFLSRRIPNKDDLHQILTS